MSTRRSQVQQYISQLKETVVVVINASTPSGASPVGNGDGVPRFSDGTTPFSGTGIGEIYASGEEVAPEDIVTTALPIVASLPVSYSINVSERYVNEGGRRVTFSICGSNVPDGTVVYWENIGTSSAADFSENVNSGSVTINKSLGSVNFTILADGLTEGNETIQLRVRTDSLSGTIVALSEVVTIADTPTYSISASASSVVEGSGTITFTITTLNIANGTTLYWQNVGTTTSTDFTQRLNSGPVVINNNTGTVSFTPIIDTLNNESTETIILRLRTLSTSGPIVATSSTVNVFNFMLTPIYAIIPNVTSLNEEGSSVVFTVSTANVASGTTLYWSNIGTASAEDFTQGLNSGTVTITNNAGTITFTTVADSTTEGNQTLQLRLRTVSQSGTIVATSTTVTITDTSLTQPTYAIAPNVPSLDEAGASVIFTVTTTNVANDTTLYWENIGTAGASDFTQGLNSGTVTINSNSGTITFTTVADSTTEGSETLQVRLRVLSSSGTIVATSSSVTITDSSTSVPTYAVAPNVPSLDEAGASVIFTVTTTNVANGTTLYWANIGTAGASDFTQAVNSGTVTINSNTATITFTTVADLTTEGSETLQLRLRTGSQSGTIVATSSSVTISDSSTTVEPTYAVAPNVPSLDEAGASVIFTVTTTDVANGTTLYWANIGTAGASDFTQGLNSGTVTINSNSATITFTTVADLTTEGSETLQVRIRTGSQSGTIVATSSSVTITDSSLTQPTYAIAPNVSSINEAGASVIFTITTTNVSDGTTLYWEDIGTAGASDFTQGLASGTVTINSNTATITFTTVADLTLEGSETLQVRIRTGSLSGTIVATSSSVTITDSSVPSEVTYDAISFTGGLGNDVFVANYNPTGRLLWASRIAGSASSFTTEVYIAEDKTVYSLSNFTNSTVPYNANGTAFGTTYTLASASHQGILLVKYSSTGVVQWGAKIQCGGNAFGYGLGVDSQGNIYVCGAYNANLSTFDSNGVVNAKVLTFSGASGDAFLVKYNPSGSVLWNTRMSSIAGENLYSLAIDASDNVYMPIRVPNNTNGSITLYESDDYPALTYATSTSIQMTVIVKYSTVGYVLTANKLTSIVYDIAFDNTKTNFYVTGGASGTTIYNIDGSTFGSLSSLGNEDVFLIKYDTSCNPVWMTRYGGSVQEAAGAVAVDTQGNIYLSGRFLSTMTAYNQPGTVNSGIGTMTSVGSHDYFLVKYNSAGVAQWQTLLGGTGNEQPALGSDSKLACDGSDNVYISGKFPSAELYVRNVGGTNAFTLVNAGVVTTNTDGFYVKYNSAGTAQWASHIRMAGTSDAGSGISATSSGYSVLTGNYGNNGVDILSG